MSIFSFFCIVFSSVTYFSTLCLRWCQLEFIWNEGSTMWTSPTLLFNVAVATVLVLIINIGAYFVAKPFDEILKVLKKENRGATQEEIRICLGSYRKLMFFVIGAFFTGSFLGQLIIMVVGVVSGSWAFVPSRLVLIMAQAVGFGGLSAISVITALEQMAIKTNAHLRMLTITGIKNSKTTNVSRSISMIFFIAIFFVGVNILSVPYGIIFDKDSGILEGEMLPLFLKKGIICTLVSMALALYPFINAIAGLTIRIKRNAERLEEISVSGDLSKRIYIGMTDDFGAMTSYMNKLIEKLSSMIKALREDADSIDESANVVSDSSHSASAALSHISEAFNKINENEERQNELISQTDENLNTLVTNIDTVKMHVVQQADAIQNISSSMTEISANISNVADMTKKASSVSEELSEKSSVGGEAITNATVAMQEIQTVSEEVRKLLLTIQQIATKTNLLSMNAAIEAAHAGQFGTGFAVVASEVRSLAESSARSAKNVQSKMQEMMEKTTAGVEAMTSAKNAFVEITGNVTENAELIKTITSTMYQQKNEAVVVRESVTDVASAIHSIKDLAEEEMESSEKLKNFMKNVLEASNSTMNAVEETLQATEHMKKTVKLVDEAADSNKEIVIKIHKNISQFEI